MNIDTAFPSKFLKAAELPENASIPLVIDHVEVQDVSGKGEKKPVIFFVGKTKGMVLNKSNAMALASSFGSETDNWRGKPVTLTRTVTLFQNQMVPAMRLTPRITPAASLPPQAAAPAATPAPETPISDEPVIDPASIPF